MSFPDNPARTVAAAAAACLALILWSCHLTSEEGTFMDIQVDSTWFGFDEVIVELQDGDGIVLDTLFEGRVESAKDLEKLPAEGYDGSKVHVVLKGIKDGKVVLVEDRHFDGKTGKNDAVAVTENPEDSTVSGPGEAGLPILAGLGTDTVISIRDSLSFAVAASVIRGELAGYTWDYDGDGAPDDSLSLEGAVATVKGGFRYRDTGTYTLRVRVFSDSDLASGDSLEVVVLEDRPFAHAGADTTVFAGDSVVLRGMARDSLGEILRMEWKIGAAEPEETEDGSFSFAAPDSAAEIMCVFRALDDDGLLAEDTVIVYVLEEEEAALLSLAVSACSTLIPEFSPNRSVYACTVPFATASTTVKARGTGKVVLNGGELGDSGQSDAIDLSMGLTLLTLVVTTGSGLEKAYEVAVLRLEASANNRLAALEVSAGSLVPSFSPDETQYQVRVDASADSIALTARLSEPASIVSVNGQMAQSGEPVSVALSGVETTIAVQVKPEKGDPRIYQILVLKPSPDAALEALELSVGALDPAFDPEVLEYSATVGQAVESLTVTASPRHEGAVVSLNGSPLKPGAPSDPVALSMGDNILEIGVAAEDTAAKRTYKVVVARLDQEPPAAPSITRPASPADVRPTWKWRSGGGGNGTYRFKLGDSVLTAGATVVSDTQFTPSTGLSDGVHTLFLQERDDAGNWSPAASASVTVISGLISWYPFNGDTKDAGINQNHATLHGPTFVSDRSGFSNSALGFDGVNDSLTTGTAPHATGTNMTVSLWAKVPSTQTDLQYFIRASGIGVFSRNGTLGLAISIPSTSSANASVNYDEWVHFAGTYDGTTIRVYINGEPLAQTSHPGTISGSLSKMTMGSFLGFWNGVLDEVRFYKRTLAASEIASLYNLTKPSRIIIKPPILDPPVLNSPLSGAR